MINKVFLKVLENLVPNFLRKIMIYMIMTKPDEIAVEKVIPFEPINLTKIKNASSFIKQLTNRVKVASFLSLKVIMILDKIGAIVSVKVTSA